MKDGGVFIREEVNALKIAGARQRASRLKATPAIQRGMRRPFPLAHKRVIL